MTESDRYSACLKTMFGLRRFGIKLGLETIQDILTALGNPQDRYKVIHVAGTNGKGSVASALANILTTAGYKAGLYTSPHLVRFNERISIDGRPIADEDVVRAYKRVREVHKGDRQPTFFEFTTAMAFYEFGRQNVDWAVVETGMGGRLDATNVVRPELSIITNISIEHPEYLGETIPQIAAEKAGIIKTGIPVVTGVDQAEAVVVITQAAAAKEAPLYRLNVDFHVEPEVGGEFTHVGIDNTWRHMRTGLAGRYQLDNAAMVLAGCELLARRHPRLSRETVREGLGRNRWPGRLEIVSTAPFVIIDGAHNLAAARNLATFLREELRTRDLTLVVGILADKPYKEMLQELVPLCRKIILTTPRIHRALPVETLHEYVRTLTSDITVIPDVGEAVKHAMSNAADNDAVCIAGSLYVVGEAKAYLETQGIPSFQRKTGH
ncbi:bifunctional folylpolyglutamate synthase/dihydrofolate synthase [Desulfococcus multivorans]|nr:folylpolyglutamate synthase/dihydrofolate synthase family protein [Desulfococcus multivorans]AOY58026.1 FolC: folylpolyglutamate synthase [Desulfococcus multivorans]